MASVHRIWISLLIRLNHKKLWRVFKMAYKFQLGPAVMSGSLTQEGGLIIKDDDGSIRLTVDRDNGALSGSGNLQIGGTVKLDGVADAAIDVQSRSTSS
jgi:hypothetical protein